SITTTSSPPRHGLAAPGSFPARLPQEPRPRDGAPALPVEAADVRRRSVRGETSDERVRGAPKALIRFARVEPRHPDEVRAFTEVLVVLLGHVLRRADSHEVVGSPVRLNTAARDDATESDERCARRFGARRV